MVHAWLLLASFSLNSFPADMIRLGDNGRLVPTQELLQLADLERNLDQALQTLSRRRGQLLTLILADISLNVQPHSRTLASRATQSEDDSATVCKLNDLTLVLGNTTVDGVGVVEVLC